MSVFAFASRITHVHDAASVCNFSGERQCHDPQALTPLQLFARQFHMPPPQGSGWLLRPPAHGQGNRDQRINAGQVARKLDWTPCGLELAQNPMRSGKGRVRDFVAKDIFDYWLQLLKVVSFRMISSRPSIIHQIPTQYAVCDQHSVLLSMQIVSFLEKSC